MDERSFVSLLLTEFRAPGVRCRSSLLLDGGTVVWIGRSGDTPPFRAQRELDLNGAYLVPGLIDAHVHLASGYPNPAAGFGGECRGSGEVSPAAVNALATRACGVTAVRDLGSGSSGFSSDLRAGWDEDPRYPIVVTAGRALLRSGGYGGFLGLALRDDVALETRVADEVAAGARVIKVIVTGSVDFRDVSIDGPYFTSAEIERVVEAARFHGIPVAAHANGPDGVERALRAGVGSIEHGILAGSDNLARMAEADVYWVPTLTPLFLLAGDPEQALLPEIFSGHLGAVAEGGGLGVRILAGTDAGCPHIPHGSLGLELRLLRQAGLSSDTVVRAATEDAAAALGLQEGYGRLEAGARTDLVWFAEDPFEAPTTASTAPFTASNVSSTGGSTGGPAGGYCLEPQGMVRCLGDSGCIAVADGLWCG